MSFRESVRHRAFPILLVGVLVSASVPAVLPVRYREPTALIVELAEAPITLWALLFGLGILQNGSGSWRDRRAPLGLAPVGTLSLQLASFLGQWLAWASGLLLIAVVLYAAPFLAENWRPDLHWSHEQGLNVVLRALIGLPGAAALLALANLTEAALGRVVGGVLLVVAFCLGRFVEQGGGEDLASQIITWMGWALAPVAADPATWGGALVALGYALTYNVLTAISLGRASGAWPELDAGLKED